MTSRCVLVALLATAPVVLSSDALPLSADSELVVAEAAATDAELAASGDQFLVVWTDTSGASHDVHGRFIQQDGSLGEPFVIAGGPLAQAKPMVASDGSRFLVAWQQGEPAEIRAARVGTDGALLDDGGFVVVPGWDPGYGDVAPRDHRLVWNGAEWFMTWMDRTSDDNPGRYARISADGSRIESSSFGGSSLRVASNGSDTCILGYSNDGDSAFGAILRADGSHVGIRGLSEYSHVGALATDGKDFLGTYYRDGTTFLVVIDASTALAREETPLSPVTVGLPGPPRDRASMTYKGRRLLVREVPGPDEPDVFLDDTRLLASAWAPEIAVSGDAVLAIATRRDTVVARLLDLELPIAAATPAPPAPPQPTPTPGRAPALGPEIFVDEPGRWIESLAVAAGGDTFAAVWSVEKSGTGSQVELTAAVIDPAEGLVLSRFPIATVTNQFRDPEIAVASDGTDYLVVWSDPYRIWGQHISSGGDAGPPFLLEDAVVADWKLRPGVTWDGRYWVVTWDSGEHFARRLTRDGRSVDLVPIRIASGASSSLVSSNGGETVVATSYEDFVDGVFVHVLRRDGSVGPTTRVSVERDRDDVFDDLESLATNGDDYLVTYLCAYRCMIDDPPSAVYRPRVWSVVVDGVTGLPDETSRQAISSVMHPHAWRDDPSSAAFGDGRWLFVEEGPDGVHLEGTLIFESADTPRIAMTNPWKGLVIVKRDESLFARALHFGTDWGPAPVPHGRAGGPSGASCAVTVHSATSFIEILVGCAAIGTAWILVRRIRTT